MIIAFLCEVNVLLKIKIAKHIEASKKKTFKKKKEMNQRFDKIIAITKTSSILSQ